MSGSCERCGFDAADYTPHDLATSPWWLAVMTDHTVEGVDAEVLAEPSIISVLGPLRATVAGLDHDHVDPDQVHRALHGLRDLGRALHDAGAGAPTQEGTVAQLSTSNGGVPKSAVLAADVGRRGLLGDRQAKRRHHGRPFQALCLWSSEVIDALVAEGHRVHPGATGENVTVSGIDWTTLRPGVRLLVGQVECELSSWAIPCRENDRWFTGRSDRIDHALHPGWSRAYAWVLEPGTITTGDPVLVEP
jgi:MOSC domain-containing protein YiiM